MEVMSDKSSMRSGPVPGDVAIKKAQKLGLRETFFMLLAIPQVACPRSLKHIESLADPSPSRRC
jgi:hypothetical protein